MLNRYNVVGRLNAIGQKGSGFPSVLLDGNSRIYDYLKQVTKDGSDFVSQWNDWLGSGDNLTEGVGSNQPKWFADNGILFDGLNDCLQGIFTYNQPEHIYLVFKQVTWTSGDRMMDGATNDSGSITQVSSSPNIRALAGSPSANNSDLALDTFGIMRCFFNGASSKLQIDSNTAITGNFGASNMGGFTLGNRADGLLAGNIQVKEAILRKIADTASDDTAIFNYLKAKYGTP
jgi:hypothetical protein